MSLRAAFAQISFVYLKIKPNLNAKLSRDQFLKYFVKNKADKKVFARVAAAPLVSHAKEDAVVVTSAL